MIVKKYCAKLCRTLKTYTLPKVMVLFFALSVFFSSAQIYLNSGTVIITSEEEKGFQKYLRSENIGLSNVDSLNIITVNNHDKNLEFSKNNNFKKNSTQNISSLEKVSKAPPKKNIKINKE